MTCRELVDVVTAYLDGALGEGDRARFERHIDGCYGCRRYLDQMRKTVAMTGRLTEEDIAPPMRERLLGAFRDWSASTA
jgi:anti-sigma factor RsiW